MRRLRRDERGTGTIEFVVWLPFFIAVIMVAFDISLTFYSMSRMWDAARHTARMTAAGDMTASDAEAFAHGYLPAHATYSVSVDDSDLRSVVVNISSDNISPSAGLILNFAPETLTASYVMRREAF